MMGVQVLTELGEGGGLGPLIGHGQLECGAGVPVTHKPSRSYLGSEGFGGSAVAPKAATGTPLPSPCPQTVWALGRTCPRPARPSTAIQRRCSSSVSGLKYQLRWLWVILKTCRLSDAPQPSGGPTTSKPMRGRLAALSHPGGTDRLGSAQVGLPHWFCILQTCFSFPAPRTLHGLTEQQENV